MDTEIKEYSSTEAALGELEEKYTEIPNCATTEGYEEARLGIAELRGYRTSLDKVRKGLGEKAREHLNNINGEAKRITLRLTALEDPLKEAKKLIDDKEERVKAEQLAKETKRISDIEEKVMWIKNAVNCARTVENLEFSIEQVNKLDISEGFDEFEEAASITKTHTLRDLESFLAIAKQMEQEAVKVEEEREKQDIAKREMEEKEIQMQAERDEMEREREKIKKEKEAMERAEFERQAKITAEKEAVERAEADKLAEIEREKEIEIKIINDEAEARRVKEIREKKVFDDMRRFNSDALKLKKIERSLSDIVASLGELTDNEETVEFVEGIISALIDIRADINNCSIIRSQGW